MRRLLFAALLLLCACASNAPPDVVYTERAATAMAVPTRAPLPTVLSDADALDAAIRDALGSGNRDVPRVESIDYEGSGVVVFWCINDNLTGDMITHGAARDVAAILEAAVNSDVAFDSVSLAGSFAMVDAFGNVSEDVVVSAVYQRATVDRIGFENFDAGNVYAIADTLLVLHPEFAP